MNGNELITITISNGIDREKQISTRYSVMEADRFRGTKREYHLMVLDNLVERFEKEYNETQNCN
jgi:hypothetical protein